MTQHDIPSRRGPVSRRELRAARALPTSQDGDSASGGAGSVGDAQPVPKRVRLRRSYPARASAADGGPRHPFPTGEPGGQPNPGTAAVSAYGPGETLGYRPSGEVAGERPVSHAGSSGSYSSHPGEAAAEFADSPGSYGRNNHGAADLYGRSSDAGLSGSYGEFADGAPGVVTPPDGSPMTAATSVGGTHQGLSLQADAVQLGLTPAGGSAVMDSRPGAVPGEASTTPWQDTTVGRGAPGGYGALGVQAPAQAPDFRASEASSITAEQQAVSRSALRAERSGGSGKRRRGTVVASLMAVVVLAGGACAVMQGTDFGGVRPPKFVSGPENGAELTVKETQFTVQSAADGLHCQLNSGNWYVCGETVELAGLYDGKHVLKVRAVVGDQLSGVASRTFSVVAQTDPVEFTTGPPSGATVWSLPVVYGVNQVAGDAEPECRVDARPWQACPTAFVVSGLEPGEHTVQVRIPGETPDERTFELSAVAPGSEAAPDDANLAGGDAGGTEASAPQVPVPVATPVPMPHEGDGWSVPTHGGGGGKASPDPGRTVAPTQPEQGPVAPAAPVSGYGVADVSALRVHEGDLTITTPGAQVDGLDVRGFVRIKAPNVTFSNSIVRGATATQSTALVQSEQPGVVLQNLTLSPTTPSVYIDGVKGHGFTARALEVNNVVDSVLIFGSNTTVEDSWLHSNRHFASDPHQGGKPSHDDGIQVEGGDHVTLRNNVVEGMHNAAIMVTQNYALTRHLTIEGNSLSGGGCTVNIAEKGRGPLVNLQIANNTFGVSRISKCPIITPKSTDIQAEGNSYSSSGEPANIRYGD